MSEGLDEILLLLGSCGRHQVFIYLLLCFPALFTALTDFNFVFTAGDLNYRCRIPECDTEHPPQYQQDWLPLAVPFEERSGVNFPSRCFKYETANDTTNGTCSAVRFLNSTVRCDEWIFDGEESTILKEFELTCDDRQWQLGLVGTVNNLGFMISVPVVGFLSDRFGRKTAFLWGMASMCVVGFSRSFATSYITFIVLEFLSILASGGIFSVVFILAMEMVGPDKRVLAGMVINAVDSFGYVVLGFVAWWTLNWRLLLRVIYIPAFLFIPYFWLAPESVRWLLARGHIDQAKAILQKAADTNGVKLPQELMEDLQLDDSDKEMKDPVLSLKAITTKVLRSGVLLLRLLVCCFCWATNSFVYYGLSFNSVELSGNKHLNFILVSLSELPGTLLAYLLLDRCGRRLTICVAMLTSGACCLVSAFTPADLSWLMLTLFFLGKLSITLSFVSLYTFTAEIFPTEIRNTMMGVCTMVGQLGSVAATQINTLARLFHNLPPMIFAGLSIVSGVAILLLPETTGTKMRDTVEESMDLARTRLADKRCGESQDTRC